MRATGPDDDGVDLERPERGWKNWPTWAACSWIAASDERKAVAVAAGRAAVRQAPDALRDYCRVQWFPEAVGSGWAEATARWAFDSIDWLALATHFVLRAREWPPCGRQPARGRTREGGIGGFAISAGLRKPNLPVRVRVGELAK